MERRLLLAGCAATLLAAASRAATEASPRRIPVVARKFVFIPNEITVRKGESVVLEFTAPEVAMGFFAPELGLGCGAKRRSLDSFKRRPTDRAG